MALMFQNHAFVLNYNLHCGFLGLMFDLNRCLIYAALMMHLLLLYFNCQVLQLSIDETERIFYCAYSNPNCSFLSAIIASRPLITLFVAC
jgi:hypothetical protein